MATVITNVFGQLRVSGKRDATGTTNSGFAELSTLLCKGVQVTDINTPWSMDQERLLLGTGARTGTTTQSEQHLTAKIFGGLAQADGIVGLTGNYPFRLNINLDDFNVAEIARDMAMPSNITGTGNARLQLSGTAEGTHTLDGLGSIQLRDANLAKLPGIVALINTMRVRNTPPDVFSSSDINLKIEGPYLNLNQFDLHGESLSLKGRGWLSLDRRLSLEFYTIAGGEFSWMPFVRNAVSQASQRLLQITADGTLDNIQWSREILPGARNAFNDLFPEQAPR